MRQIFIHLKYLLIVCVFYPCEAIHEYISGADDYLNCI